jgi:hypothetical protein
MAFSTTTQVHYHNKSPTFQDEIKAKLPIKLHSKHHLLFKFYHIVCQAPQKGEDELEVPIGFAVLPLYADGRYLTLRNILMFIRIVLSDTHNLPVIVSDLKPGYLSDKSAHYLDSGKPCFRVRLHVMSSIYPQDSSLSTFFRLAPRSESLDKDIITVSNIK